MTAARARLDAELVRRGLARSREQAGDLVAAGRVAVAGQRAAKPATQVARDAPITVTDPGEPGYVSRGGHKLAGALAVFGDLVVSGRNALDAGASTGGFTDVLLRAGAAHVLAADVGRGQLAWSLRTDPRVTVMDRVNVRALGPVTPVPDLVVADLSFISLTLVLPALVATATPEADFVLLVKPQFEVGKGRVGAGGVVRDTTDRSASIEKVAGAAAGLGLGVQGITASPLPGPAGNVEYFLWLRRGAPPLDQEQLRAGDRGGTQLVGQRTMLVTAHTGRENAVRSARLVAQRLAADGIAVRTIMGEISYPGAAEVPPTAEAAEGAELVIVLGGDGSLLRAAELSRPAKVPLIGVNLGHVGFLAEAEPDGLADLVERVVARQYTVEERMTIDVTVRSNGSAIVSGWALNEATVEKAARERVIDVITEIDGRPLSRWGCDGVVCSTPTGSTAYAFSAGGPVVWPDVEALLMVPISAHALFAPPMVVSPQSVLAVELIAGDETSGAVLWCDGRRKVDLPPGARVEVRRGALPVLLARLHGPGPAGFTDRLVAKFGLPVAGWRGRTREDTGEHA